MSCENSVEINFIYEKERVKNNLLAHENMKAMQFPRRLFHEVQVRDITST